MKTIKGEKRYTRQEVLDNIAGYVTEWGTNQSQDGSGMSYRHEGFPGTGGGTIAISYVLPVTRKGVAYYKQIPFAS